MREQVAGDAGQRQRADRVQPRQLDRVEDLFRGGLRRPIPPFDPIVVPSLSEGQAIANGAQAAECRRVGTQQDLFSVDSLRGPAGEGPCARADGFYRLRGESGHVS